MCSALGASAVFTVLKSSCQVNSAPFPRLNAAHRDCPWRASPSTSWWWSPLGPSLFLVTFLDSAAFSTCPCSVLVLWEGIFLCLGISAQRQRELQKCASYTYKKKSGQTRNEQRTSLQSKQSFQNLEREEGTFWDIRLLLTRDRSHQAPQKQVERWSSSFDSLLEAECRLTPVGSS